MLPDRSTQIEAIGSLPEQLEAAVRGLTDEQLDTPYRQGGWTVRQVVHHLADSHMNAFVRMKLILTEQRPRLKAYEQERWADTADVAGVPIEASTEILRGLHRRWVMLLQAVRQESWTRAADHPETGEVTLESLLAVYAHHGENHVGQILQLRASRGW